MIYQPLFVVVDDNLRIRENFLDLAPEFQVEIRTFETWDVASEFLDQNENVDGLILDAKGKLTADRQESDAHLQKALKWLSKQEGHGRIIPYLIHTAFYDDLETFSEEQAAGKMIPKGQDSESKTIKKLKELVQETPKLKIINQFPEPFQCFGTKYLDKRYENLLLNIILVLENNQLTNPKDLLFNPCRILLERVFEKVTEVNNRVLPYALLNFESQRVGLVNCSRFLSGLPVKVRVDRGIVEYKNDKYWEEFLSQQVQTIIKICHPASHDIQKYSRYTFQSVLWAIFDLLVWLKKFIDEQH